ncbi:ATP-dependent zinc metalloprotease FtsH [Rhodopirellula baltica]|uniref:ATP-dependent zinc metalloprotease FtsH 1 n=4 Tax=Rhodopirellula baltica TaxID=265606 RepID=FTSH1_RHOBA|nr:ATP-dependent zinc metalloprotease FtsH [Rhodopirellula baltica]Q7UUZ7.1 RecName: Full=ATP-dependent zinc metalloprotease FtsH 1 [Rhodopirellula baltica SH 1]EGF28548.1 ATP-dependent zinc metalloprotease FtsH [Rhodopirellula baltica WH47]EKK01979.1 cell division protein FtsH [Rhodopirellula baltica SH28]ELP32947.1 cell division protein FtsH [Rhodopirellula baltica SWK14]CAD72930.1 cell division protein FtsH [Rhodopirellula baltica SH 1]HBE63989.1 ATP-dependent zinc metalloprotease FtsH 1 [
MKKDSESNSSDKSNKEELSTGRRGGNPMIIALVITVLAAMLFFNQPEPSSLISASFFRSQLEKNNIESVEIGDIEVSGTFKTRPQMPASESADGDAKPKELLKRFRFTRPAGADYAVQLSEDLEKRNIKDWKFSPPDNTAAILNLLILVGLPLAIFFFIFMMIRRTRNDMMGGGFLSGFSKSPAKRFEATDKVITFNDVAGLEGVKADLQEIVDFLKTPEKFQKLGGQVPKGVLLNGPPGTGKTLLARAVAGEADVPFFSVNGSEFIQMFVGVGASRVRDLFKTAKEQSPSIIFIDEIDAVGRQRGAGLGGGHDEREQTLNQILGEMDGFGGAQAVIVIAATNRPDVLDPALLRPGRFDRHVTVGRPTMKGREEIFKVHVRDVPLGDDVDLHRLAAGTVGLTGADIRNMVNEAALWAARGDKKIVEMSDFDYARDKILMGAKREEVLLESEKEKTAYHEAGHTLTAWHLEGSHIVHKVTIIPRGRALGVTQYVPNEDRLSMSKRELEHQLIVLLGGRAAEKIIYTETCVGAENDLERATSIARRMVTHWGMSPKIGPVSYKTSDEDPFLGREIHQQRQFSEHTQELIDEEVARILMEADQKAEQLLREHRGQLETITRELLDREELNEAELTELIGPSIHKRLGDEEGKVEQIMAPEGAAERTSNASARRED